MNKQKFLLMIITIFLAACQAPSEEAYKTEIQKVVTLLAEREANLERYGSMLEEPAVTDLIVGETRGDHLNTILQSISNGEFDADTIHAEEILMLTIVHVAADPVVYIDSQIIAALSMIAPLPEFEISQNIIQDCIEQELLIMQKIANLVNTYELPEVAEMNCGNDFHKAILHLTEFSAED